MPPNFVSFSKITVWLQPLEQESLSFVAGEELEEEEIGIGKEEEEEEAEIISWGTFLWAGVDGPGGGGAKY